MAKRQNNRRQQGFTLKKEVTRFIESDFGKFKKRNKAYYDSKKDLKKAYYREIIEDYLGVTLTDITKYSNIPEIRDIKNAVYGVILGNVEEGTSGVLISELVKFIDSGRWVDGLEYFPIVCRDICILAKAQAKVESENTGTLVEPELDDLIGLSKLILKKRLKKFVKAGIPEDVAFDLLSIVPNHDCVDGRAIIFKMRSIMAVLYEHAKTKELDYTTIIEKLLPDDTFQDVMVFNLLERKDKYNGFDDKQKEFFIAVNEVIFKVLEKTDKKLTRKILEVYVDVRKRDDERGKESPRRYNLTSLPETEFPNVSKIVKRMVDENPDIQKYLS